MQSTELKECRQFLSRNCFETTHSTNEDCNHEAFYLIRDTDCS